MRPRWPLFPFLPALALGIAFAASAAAARAAVAPPAVQEWTVAEGTVGALVEDHRVPLVEVTIEFAAGTWSPWFERNHAEEAFEIQLRDPRGELRRRSDRLGLRFAIFAGNRESTIDFDCQKRDLEPALQLVRDILANRDFDRAELQRRKRNSALNWIAAEKEPGFRVRQAAARLLFRADDPRRRAFEKPEPLSTDVAALGRTRDVLVRLPGRVIGFAGDLTLAEAQRFAADLLPAASQNVPQGLAPVFGPVTGAGERPREHVEKMARLTQVYFAYGRESLSFTDGDYPASLIADHVLGGHFYSRLMVALRQDGGETYGAGARSTGGMEPGSYGLATFTRTANAPVVEKKLREVLATFRAGGITEEERALAAGHLVGRRAFARQSPGQALNEWLWCRRKGLPADFLDRVAQQASELSQGEVNAFIERFYDPALFTMLKVM